MHTDPDECFDVVVGHGNFQVISLLSFEKNINKILVRHSMLVPIFLVILDHMFQDLVILSLCSFNSSFHSCTYVSKGSTLIEGQKSAIEKPPNSTSICSIVDTKASWSLHFVPLAALAIIAIVTDSISLVVRLIIDPSLAQTFLTSLVASFSLVCLSD